jgi:hypothetical protein
MAIDRSLMGRTVRFSINFPTPAREEGQIVALGERDSAIMGIEPYAWILTTDGYVTSRRLDELTFPVETK